MQTEYDLMRLGFTEKEAMVLLLLLEEGLFSKEDFIDNNLCFDESQYEFCEVLIVLKKAVLNTELRKYNYIEFRQGTISKTNSGYMLTAVAESDNDVSFQLCINFESVEISCKSLKAKLNIFEDLSPWWALAWYALNIYEKIKRPYLDVNNKEKALEPLLRELSSLVCFNEYNQSIEIDVLKSHLPNDKQLNRFFEKLNMVLEGDKLYKRINKLFLYLTQSKFENSWRNILRLLNESQADYPDQAENFEENRMLAYEYSRIDEIMHSNGFTGRYPAYEKETKIKGIHLKKNNDELFFVGREQAKIFINCVNNRRGDFKNIEFQISTFLIKSGDADTPLDKYSCLFAKKGKGYFRTMCISYEIDDAGSIKFERDAEYISNIVCKIAELKRLSKTERKAAGITKSFREIIFLLAIWFVGGLFFGMLLTAGFMLLEFLGMFIMGRLSEFYQIFLQTPWWMIFLFSSIGFGGVMGVLTVIAD